MTESALQAALIAVMDEVGYVQKDARNDHHKYRYASAEAVLTKVRAACARHGVAITGSRSELLHAEGKLCVVRITQTYSMGAESATFQGLGGGSDSQDKGPMKASTAALKYLLSNAFNISWGDDPEATDVSGASTSEKKYSHPRLKGRRKVAAQGGPRANGALAEPAVLAQAIASATTLRGLEKAKESIRAMEDSADKEALKKSYGERKEALHEAGRKAEKKAAKAAQKGAN